MPLIEEKFYREVRCPNCHKLLGYEYVHAGRLLFNCTRCGEMATFEFKHLKTKANMTELAKDYTIAGSNQ